MRGWRIRFSFTFSGLFFFKQTNHFQFIFTVKLYMQKKKFFWYQSPKNHKIIIFFSLPNIFKWEKRFYVNRSESTFREGCYFPIERAAVFFFFFQARTVLYKKNLELDPLPLALKKVSKISWKSCTTCLCFGASSYILTISYSEIQ